MPATPESQGPLALLLMDLGGPDSLEAVKPFLFNLLSDPLVLDIPFGPGARRALARFIVWRRHKTSRGYYERIGGKSPIGPLTAELGVKVAAELEKRLSRTVRSYVGFRCWHPFISEALESVKNDGLRRVIGLSLFPQYHRATTLSCILELRRLTEGSLDFDVSVVDRFARDGGYLDAVAQTVREGLDHWRPDERPNVHVLFSAHGAIQSVIDAGDPYKDECEAVVKGVLSRLPDVRASTLAYQSRATSAEWLKPYTDLTLKSLARSGVKDVLMVPISFASDNVETLYEMDILYAGMAKEAGITRFHRAPAMNGRPSFVAALASLVERHLREMDALRREVA